MYGGLTKPVRRCLALAQRRCSGCWSTKWIPYYLYCLRLRRLVLILLIHYKFNPIFFVPKSKYAVQAFGRRTSGCPIKQCRCPVSNRETSAQIKGYAIPWLPVHVFFIPINAETLISESGNHLDVDTLFGERTEDLAASPTCERACPNRAETLHGVVAVDKPRRYCLDVPTGFQSPCNRRAVRKKNRLCARCRHLDNHIGADVGISNR